ncbi:DUF2750 domain-containing protein [Thalassomonas actiniarum]|uniref:DUF2750 domain-containing protein n=1 Tax=Thalassomonas actiniarum TaxID=485447 RepID=A0AAE9YVH5_9GAMM|nr:DUF2750 domain-containing protein [Thalassomonas actiniarum]WDE01100.1 DUF2750 domain-containing protein [Thalassomonas actiniarum]
MSDNKQENATEHPVLAEFLSAVKPEQVLWALQDKDSEDWVVLASVNFEETDVMPVWSSEQLAGQHCIDEWQDYQPAQISVSDWLEFWIEDLNEDGIIIGVNWPVEGDCLELELADFSQAIAAIEDLA